MRREVFRYVEAELFDYPWTLKEIARLRADIALEGVALEEALLGARVSGGRLPDPTREKAIRLITNRRLKRMEETVEAIERVLSRLPAEMRELVRLRYWERWGRVRVCEELHISERTYYRWRAAVVRAVAVEMGLVNGAEEAAAG